MKKTNKKWLIGSIITLLCTALCLYVAIEAITAFKNNRPPQLFGLSISYVPTDSMQDVIQPGDYVLFSKTSYEKVGKGDIIVYRSKEGPMAGKYIIHRIVEEKEGYFITQGDHNPVADQEIITPDMVYGKFICVVGLLSIFSGVHRNGIYIFFAIIFIVLIGLQATSIILKYKKDKLTEEQKKSQIDIEQLKKEILEEELEKIRKQNIK